MLRRLIRLGRALLRPTERRRLVRWRVWRLVGRVTPFAGVEAAGVRFVLSTRDKSAGASVFVSGRAIESRLLGRLDAALARYSSVRLRGATVLEAGANIGTETVWMQVRHGVRHVVAIEPDPESRALLLANVALNGLEKCTTVLPYAITDCPGPLQFECVPTFTGDQRIRVEAPEAVLRLFEEKRETIEVEGRSLDGLAEEGVIDPRAIDLVWIDVQGHEAHVLAGASSFRSLPVVAEFWPYGLRRAGALERFQEIVAQRYSRVIDLEAGGLSLPPSRIASLAVEYERRPVSHPFGGFTELLLLP